jgi:hypothetical protein
MPLTYQREEWDTVPSWYLDYDPHWVFSYKLTASRKDTFKALERAMIEACGPNSEDTPYRVEGDEEEYTYLNAHCENRNLGQSVLIDYDIHDGNSTIEATVGYQAAECSFVRFLERWN